MTVRIQHLPPVGIVAVAGLAVLAAGCVPKYRPLPYIPKPVQPPAPLICHDRIGHIKGNKPWIMGGNCCCTPTRTNYELHVAQGTIDRSVTYEQYLAMYKAKNIVTGLDHKGCGNFCAEGPHVVLGGRCMAPPTPGTWMFERVTYGPHALPGVESAGPPASGDLNR